MRVAIDAMGNDQGPLPIVEGVGAYLRHDTETTVILVGERDALRRALIQTRLGETPHLQLVHASQVMEMQDKVSALREKRDSSIVRVVQEVKEGRADAMVALGNTAAAVGATCIGLRNLHGVHRPGIALPLPTRQRNRPCVLIDMGANTAAKPEHLVDYAVMASIYSEQILHVREPRVGLLNVGEERGKGNEALREAFEMLEEAPLNFIGNVEGRDIYAGTCDVVVTDGFTGNVVLKVSEELASTLSEWTKEAFHMSWMTKLAGWLATPAFRALRQRTSYDRYGGAPLLGVNGICIIGHGRSNSTAVFNALRVAKECAVRGVNRRIQERLAQMQPATDETAGPENAARTA